MVKVQCSIPVVNPKQILRNPMVDPLASTPSTCTCKDLAKSGKIWQMDFGESGKKSGKIGQMDFCPPGSRMPRPIPKAGLGFLKDSLRNHEGDSVIMKPE